MKEDRSDECLYRDDTIGGAKERSDKFTHTKLKNKIESNVCSTLFDEICNVPNYCSSSSLSSSLVGHHTI